MFNRNDMVKFGGRMKDNLFYEALLCALVGLLFGFLYLAIMEAISGLQH